ncbi:hypothetical protein Tco_0065044, partial [Tanacetum coccineum]
ILFYAKEGTPWFASFMETYTPSLATLSKTSPKSPKSVPENVDHTSTSHDTACDVEVTVSNRVHVPPPQRQFTHSQKQKCTPSSHRPKQLKQPPHWPKPTPFSHRPKPTPFSHTPKQFKQPPPPSKPESKRKHVTTPDPQRSSSSTNEYHPLEDYYDLRALFKKGEECIGKYIDDLNQNLKNLGTSNSSNANARSQRETVRKLFAGDLRNVPDIGPQRAESILNAKRESTHLEIRKLRPIISFEMVSMLNII